MSKMIYLFLQLLIYKCEHNLETGLKENVPACNRVKDVVAFGLMWYSAKIPLSLQC